MCMLGLSICQELALDEDEEDRDKGEGGDSLAGSLLREEVQTPVQLSNALMKALKVGGDDRVGPSPTQPKNQDNKRKSITIHCVYIANI